MAKSPLPFSLERSARPEVDLDALAATWDANTRTQEAMVRSMRRIERVVLIEVLSMAIVAWVGVATLVRHLDAAAAQREEQRAMLAAALAAQVAVTDAQLEAEAVDAELVESVEPVPAPVVVVPQAAAEAVVQKRAAAREQAHKALRMLGEIDPRAPDASRPE